MKKYLVIGNPIDHSLSPRLHNYWFRENNIDAIYEKKQIKEIDIKRIISDIRNNKIEGINVTVPFKKSVIPFLDRAEIPENIQSVNTIYSEKNNITGLNKIIGTNTDIVGFKYALEHTKFSIKGKKIFILGAGGVTPSIIYVLQEMEPSIIMLSNRTKEKAENLKKLFPQLELIEWGDTENFDMIINTTSLGLKENDKLPVNYDRIGSGKFFYDVIYNPIETNFLKIGKSLGNITLNGKLMFIYQALSAFNIWHGLEPDVDENIIKLLDQ